MRKRTPRTGTNPAASGLKSVPAAGAPTIEETLDRLVATIQNAPQRVQMYGAQQALAFFEELLAGYRARPVSNGFWLHVESLCAPLLAAWEAWTRAPDHDTRTQVELTLVAFCAGFGSISFRVVQGALSSEIIDACKALQQVAQDLSRPPDDEDDEANAVWPPEPIHRAPEVLSQHGAIFAIPAHWPKVWYWHLRSQQDLEDAPWRTADDLQRNQGPHARALLSGEVLKLWLATWVLSAERGDSMGVFKLDPHRLSCDLYCDPPEVTIAPNGRRLERASHDTQREIEERLRVLERLYVCGVGSLVTETPEALLVWYTLQETQQRIYRPNALIWRYANMSFTHVPRAVLRLDASFIPLALGVADFWRARLTSARKASTKRGAPLSALREAFEQIPEAPQPANVFIEQLRHVLEVGELGALSVTGKGEGTRATLEPPQKLCAAYEAFAYASDPKHETTDFGIRMRRAFVDGNQPKPRRKKP